MSSNIPEHIAAQKVSKKSCQFPKNGNSPFNNLIGCKRHLKRMRKARKVNQHRTHRNGRNGQSILAIKMTQFIFSQFYSRNFIQHPSCELCCRCLERDCGDAVVVVHFDNSFQCWVKLVSHALENASIVRKIAMFLIEIVIALCLSGSDHAKNKKVNNNSLKTNQT